MLVTDYKQPGPEEGPEPGSRWTIVFDGASNALGNGIGVVIIYPTGGHTPFTPRRFAAKFILSNGIMYKHNHDSTLFRCVNKKEAEQIMEDIHDGAFGTH